MFLKHSTLPLNLVTLQEGCQVDRGVLTAPGSLESENLEFDIFAVAFRISLRYSRFNWIGHFFKILFPLCSPASKTGPWCSQQYHQKPHFLWLSWGECTKCASHSSAAIRHSPSINLPPKLLPSNGECTELVLKFVNYIYEFHGLVVLTNSSVEMV